MFKHNLHITVHAKDQKTLDAVFANISNSVQAAFRAILFQSSWFALVGRESMLDG